MKVIVIGATGNIGRLAVRRMLEEGHVVTAFARRPLRVGIKDPNLSFFAGDALSEAQVTSAIKGHDAVVITIGAGASRKSVIRSQGTMNVIQAMHRTGVRRLICQSTLGAHESRENLDFFWKRIMFGVLLAPVLRDHELQEDLVRASGLDWTIVRPSAFTDEQGKGSYQEGFGTNERKLRLKISRADVAGFLTRQLRETRYVGRAVGISD